MLYLAQRLGYITEIGKLLNGLINSISKKLPKID